MRERKVCTLSVMLAAAFCAATFISVIPPAAEGDEKITPQKLFEQKCSQCHSLDDPRSQRNTKAEWTQLVKRMRGNGCDLSDDEAETIVGYLSKNFGK
ncbi:MAG: hypothetical protein EPN22_11355 [Nitrospirae bacterium]|nr:MAG: hypothetical protein EPN22_11355 [Nitrospirota bacterium]